MLTNQLSDKLILQIAVVDSFMSAFYGKVQKTINVTYKYIHTLDYITQDITDVTLTATEEKRSDNFNSEATLKTSLLVYVDKSRG